MNWDQVEGGWKQALGVAKQKWGKITDGDWAQVTGKRDELAGMIQQRYGKAKEDAEKEVDDWYATMPRDPKARV